MTESENIPAEDYEGLPPDESEAMAILKLQLSTVEAERDGWREMAEKWERRRRAGEGWTKDG